MLVFGRDTLDPASMVSDHILVEDLADCHNLLVDMVHLEVLVYPKMYLDLLDGVDSLI